MHNRVYTWDGSTKFFYDSVVLLHIRKQYIPFLCLTYTKLNGTQFIQIEHTCSTVVTSYVIQFSCTLNIGLLF
jgi:hypothetical protein